MEEFNIFWCIELYHFIHVNAWKTNKEIILFIRAFYRAKYIVIDQSKIGNYKLQYFHLIYRFHLIVSP